MGCYCVHIYVGVSPSTPFGLFSVFCYPSDSCLISQIPCFLRQIIFVLASPCGNVCVIREWGGVGSHWWIGGVLVFVREVKLAHNLMCQLDSQFRISVWILVPQGTVYSSSADNTWVKSCKCECDSTVYPTLYVQNGFVHFIFHGLTQLRKNDQKFLT